MIRLNPQDAFAFNNRGKSWVEKKEYDRAIADFNEAIRFDPKFAFAFSNRGAAWVEKEDPDRAIADFNEAIRLDPKYASAFFNRGNSWRDKRDYGRAIVDYSEAIRLNPQDASVFYTRGLVQFFKGEFTSAASDLLRSEQLQPSTYTALLLYLARSRSASADGKAELALNTSGVDGKKWPAAVVALYLGEGDLDIVISQAADPDPEADKVRRCGAHFFLGEWHLLRGEKPQALTLLTQTKNSCPRRTVEYDGAIAELERLK